MTQEAGDLRYLQIATAESDYASLQTLSGYTTKTYADDRYLQSSAPLNTLGIPTGNINMNAYGIFNMGDPVDGIAGAEKYAASRSYVLTQVATVNQLINDQNNTIYALDQQVQSLNDVVTTLDGTVSGLWRAATVINLPSFASAVNLASYMADLVKDVDFFGYGTSIENVGIDNNGTQMYRCFLITVPDPGFDILPMFQEEINAGTDTGQFRTPNNLPPHTIASTIAKAPGVGVYTICKRAITANYRTSFLVVIRKDQNANYPSKVFINWVKRNV